jgi:hypothetical protein
LSPCNLGNCERIFQNPSKLFVHALGNKPSFIKVHVDPFKFVHKYDAKFVLTVGCGIKRLLSHLNGNKARPGDLNQLGGHLHREAGDATLTQFFALAACSFMKIYGRDCKVILLSTLLDLLFSVQLSIEIFTLLVSLKSLFS